MIEITLPYFPALRTLNHRGRNPKAWSVTRQVREDAAMLWRKQLQVTDVQARLGLPLQVGVRVHVGLMQPDHRRRDLDNMVGLVKPMLDAAVDAGVLVDDAQVIGLDAVKIVDPRAPRVWVALEVLGGEWR